MTTRQVTGHELAHEGAGNPSTTARLREQGAEVIEYEGDEISVARISGPTCNTRPLLRLA